MNTKQNQPGRVIVISGVSGSGKSTLGEALLKYFIENGRRAKLLDGDMLRRFFDGDLQYSSSDRLMVSKILAYTAYLLAEQGVDVVLATMLSQKGAREFLADKLDFIEVFLDAPFEKCVDNDCKQVYLSNLTKEKPNIVGHDLSFFSPESPELTIQTHTETPEVSLNRIIEYLALYK